MFNNRKLDYTIIRRIVATILLVSFISTSSNAAFALAPSGKLNDESFQQAYASLDSTTRVLDAIGEALYLKMPISGVREMVERRTGKPSPITIDRIEDAAVCFSFRDPQGKIRYYRCFLAEDGIIPADSIRLSLPGDRVYWRQEIDEPMPSSTRQPPKNAETAARLSHEAFVSYLNIEFPDRRKDYDSRISLIIRYGLHDGDEIDVLISKTYKVLSRPSEALPADVKDVVNFLLLLDVNEGWLKRVFFQYEKLFDKEAGMDGSANKRASIGKVQDDPGYLWSNPSVSDSFIKSAGYFEKFLKYKKNDVSLHILAGMGREAIYMAKRNPGMTFFSLDANIFNMRESLSELADIEKEAVPLQNLRLIMADARATHQGIPLPENSVDSVVIIGQGFASMIKNEVFGITQEVLKVINKNGGVILFDGEDMPEEMRQAIEVRKDVVTESVYDGRLGNYLFPIHVIRIKKRNDTSLKSPELSGWGLDGVKKALKDLAPTDWYYRTAVIPMKNGQVLAVKFLKKGEDPAVLEKEAIIMRDLNSAGISVPVPQRMVGDTYTFACGVTPSNPPYGVDNSYQCIAYLARPEYFIYPEDIKDTGTMRRCAVNSMDQFARMLKVGYVHTSLSPLSHAQSMEKPWMWNHNPLGGVEDMEEAAAKSNIRLAGVADFAHVRLTLPGESLYNETVQALCEWIIVITYHSLKNGITEGDVALILKDGLNEFLKITDLKNGITVTESDRLEEFINAFHGEFKKQDIPFQNTSEAAVFDKLVHFVTSVIDRRNNGFIFRNIASLPDPRLEQPGDGDVPEEWAERARVIRAQAKAETDVSKNDTFPETGIRELWENLVVKGHVYHGTDANLLASIREKGLSSGGASLPYDNTDYQFFRDLVVRVSNTPDGMKTGNTIDGLKYFESEVQTGFFVTNSPSSAETYARQGPERLRFFVSHVGSLIGDYENGGIRQSLFTHDEILRLKSIFEKYNARRADTIPIVLNIPISVVIPLLPEKQRSLLTDYEEFEAYIKKRHENLKAHGVATMHIDMLVKQLLDQLFRNRALTGTIPFAPEMIPANHPDSNLASNNRLAAPLDQAEVIRAKEEAARLEHRILTGEKIGEDEVKKVFYPLAERILSEKGLDAFRRVNDFYTKVCSSEDAARAVIKKSDRIAKEYLSRVPFISMVYGAGQVYAGMYDPTPRRFLAFMQLLRGEIDEFDFLRRDMPDYDFIHVFEAPSGTVFKLERNSAEKMRVFFRDLAADSSEWRSMLEGLMKETDISSVRLTRDIGERTDTIGAFAKNFAIPLCLRHPVPFELWNKLPLLVCEGDFGYLSCIRDLLISLDDPVYSRSGIAKTVPADFQTNFLLNQIAVKGPRSADDILKTVFGEAARSMSDRPRHDAAPGLVDYARRGWERTFKRIKGEGLVEVSAENRFTLTDKGRDRIARILAGRNELLAKGFVTAGDDEEVGQVSQQDPDRQPVEGLNNVILSVPEKSVTSPQIQIESVRKPVAVKSAPDRNAVLTGLKRMQRMFAAYEDILSDHGRMIASAVDEAVAAVETNPSDFVLARGQELISLMPDPQRLDLDKDGDKNWMKWFSIPSIIKDVDVIGRGCRQACLHCLMKNMGGCEERDPLPIVIEKLKRHEGKFFSGWLGNDPLDWRDPFFNVGIDAIVELAQRSRPDLHFTFTTRGWDVDDLHAQATAERLASLLGKNPDNFLRLSFHLLRSRYDLVADIFYNNGKVSEELIEAYARRYANIIRTLNGNISQVFLSFIPDFEPYNVAAREVFMRALGYAGFDAEAVKTAGKIIAEKQSGEVTSGARHFELTASNAIVHSGRGADLFYRLRLALQGDRDCLEPIYSYEMSDDKSKRPWPVVVVTDKGQVSVARRRGTFASTLDELDPMIPLMSPAVSAPEPATQAHESGMIEQETITLPFEQFLEMKKKRVTPTQIVENVQIPNVNFDLPDQIDTPETACKAIFDHEINIRRFLGVASLLRKKYPYGLTKDISKRPLQYAIDENIVYPLGSGLFMTPITESFRRHIIFKKRTDGSVAFAFEVLIPGEMRHKKKLIIDKRRSIAEEILSAFPGRRYCEKPIFWKRIPNGSYELYGERSEFNDAQPLSVMAFEYTEDGKRLDFVSSKTLDFISVEAGIPRGQIDEHIARQAGELTAAVHGLGYIGHEQFKVEALAHVRAGVYELKQGTFNNVELQASNFRIIWGRGFVRLKLVGDFEGYTKADKFRDPEYRRKKDLQLIIEGEDREMRGLKDILRIDSSSLYTIFYEEYKKRGIGFLLPLNKNRDSDQLPAPPADQIDPRLEQPVDGDVPLEKEEQLARLAASARVAADLSAEASRSPIVIEKADRVVPNGPSPSKNGTKYDRIIRHVYSMLSRHFKTEEIESFNLHALEWREEKVSINYLFRNMPNARSAYSDYQDWVNKGRNKENSDWFILLEKYLTRDCSKAPPIVVVLDKNGTRLLEGVRRVVAAKVRGDTAVNAYIGEPPPSVGYKKSAAIPERGIPQPQIDPAPDAMDGWRMETHSDGMSREDMAAGAATEAIDSGTVINIIKEMLTIGYHNGHLMDYMDQINAEKILRLSDRVRSLILVKSQKKSYILEHTVLKGGSKAEGARGIIKNGFDWSRFSRTRTCGAGRGIWTRIIKEDESMIYNDFDPHTIKIRFEGNVLDEKDAKVIAWEIRRLLGGGILGDCPSELWADDLSHDIFDLIMRVNGVDAIFVRKAATMEAIVIKNQKAITIEPSSRSAAVSADAPAIPGAVGGAFDFKQIFSDHDWADRYLDILRRNFSRGGSVKGLCFISSAVLGLWMQDGALKMEMLTDANRYEAFLKGPACFEIKMGYHLNKATGAKDPHHWIVITEKGKTYFFDAIYNAEWGYGGDKLIFEEILSEDNIERKYGLFEFRAAAEDYDTSRVGIDELQMFRYEEAVNAKWDILKKGTKSLKTILDNPRYGSRMRPALAELSEKITAPVLHELSSAERKEIEWFREIFHAYKGNGILSFEGLRLLDEAAVSIKSSHKNLSCIRILEVADYFRRIPDMTGDQVRAGFPQKYFKEIDMLPFDSERYLTTMLLDGCHNQCPWCPVHKTARMVAMPYPLLIMMSMKDSMCRFLNTTLYEPLYYRDICGASMYDVLKLDEVRSSILTHGSMEDHDELADWNIERINKSGKQCIFNISLDFAGADYSKKFSMVEDVDFIAEYYFHRSLNFIRKVDRHTVAVTFGYPPDICSDDNNDIRKWRQIVPKVRAMLENALRAEGYIINGDIRKYKKVISFNDMRYQALSQRALQYMDTGMAPETIARAVEKNMFSETHYLVRPDGSVAISLPPSYIKPSILPGGFTDAMRERFIDALVNKDNFLLTLEPYLSVLGAYTYKVHREEWPLFPFDSDKPGSHRAYSERAVDRIIKWDFPVPVKCIVDKKGITDLIAAGAIKLNYHEVALGSIYRPEKQKVAIPVAAGTSGALPASTVPKQYPAFDMVEVIPAREAREVIQAETLANRIKIYASEAKREKAKVIIGIETAGWVPDEQKSDMHALTRGVKQFVDTLNRRGVLDNITVVLGNSETLLTNIANEKPGKSDKIVVLGSEKTLTSDSYMAFDAFKACIDLRELENLDYIRLLEVLTVALNLGLGGETHAASIVSHPDIGIQTIGERIVRLIPSKRIDINEPSKVYRLQIKELAKQA